MLFGAGTGGEIREKIPADPGLLRRNGEKRKKG